MSFKSPASRGYLFLYNISMTAGWSAVLYHLCASLSVFPENYAAAYAALQPALRVAQTGAVLEVLHSAMGLVRAPVSTTALQVASRLLLLWGVVEPLPAMRSKPAMASMVGAWALTEIPRYAFFAWGAAAGTAPYWLGLLRYSTFLPLYPIGAGSEMLLLFLALPVLREMALFSVSMPNEWNFAFDFTVFCAFNLVMYVPGLPHMYLHMMRQRRRFVSKAAEASFGLEKSKVK
jgi:very-long-chain (3R)-3-hydroxyacyl-CoA dehydratase